MAPCRGARNDQVVADVADVLGAAGERADQAAAGELVLGEAVDSSATPRPSAAAAIARKLRSKRVPCGAGRRGRCARTSRASGSACCRSRSGRSGTGRSASRSGGASSGAHSGVTVSSPSGTTITPVLARHAVDDVGVELVVGEARVVGAGGEPHLDAGELAQKARQARREPLRGEARRGVQAQHHAGRGSRRSRCRGAIRRRRGRRGASARRPRG